MSEAIVFERSSELRAALRLEIATIIWMIIEAVAAIAAGIVARSLLLAAFGIDSAIELASAVVVFRRFRIESHEKFSGDLNETRSIERKTARIAGYLLFLLAAYVLGQAGFGLVTRHAADTSPVGIAVAIIAAIGMPFLAKAKLRVADRIDSRALRADAMETLTCGYLAWALLAGLALSAVTHWWWLDSVAALALIPFLIKEAQEAISAESIKPEARVCRYCGRESDPK
jgi:divalent metal cation (Fe/Co/Zn/Cd) transporter